MSESPQTVLANRLTYGVAAIRPHSGIRLATRLLVSITLALPLAVIAVGAADTVDLPHTLQFLVTHLDIAHHLPFGPKFPGSTDAFVFWTLPINVLFYGGFLFAFFSWRALWGERKVRLAHGAVSSERVASPLIIDSGISTLATVFDSGVLARQLQALSSCPWWGALGDIRVSVLKWHRTKRCTFEITFQAGIVGKVYSTDCQDEYEYMKKLQDSGFGPEAELSIPQPIAYIPHLRLLLQERVEGTRAEAVFRSGNNREREQAAERCAAWLARFHALAPPAGKVVDIQDLLDQCEKKWCFIAVEDADLALKAEELFKQLQTSSCTRSHGPMRAGHGDFAYHQMVFSRGRTIVFDWDVYETTDPTRDVARFMVSLERLALKYLGSLNALDGAAETFLQTYLNSGGPPQVTEDRTFHKAANYLWYAQWEAKTKRRGWRQRAEIMLDEALCNTRSACTR